MSHWTRSSGLRPTTLWILFIGLCLTAGLRLATAAPNHGPNGAGNAGSASAPGNPPHGGRGGNPSAPPTLDPFPKAPTLTATPFQMHPTNTPIVPGATFTPTPTPTDDPRDPSKLKRDASPTPSGADWAAPSDEDVRSVSDKGVPVFRAGAFRQLSSLAATDRDKINAGVFPLILWSPEEIDKRLSKIFSFKMARGALWVGLLVQTTDGGTGLAGAGARDINVYDGGIATLSITPDRIPDLARLPGVVKVEPDYLNFPTLDASLAETNVRAVHQSCDLLGQGVTVGVLDTGIDVNHADFIKGNGASKIAWYFSEANGLALVPYVAPGTGSTNEWSDLDLNTAAGRANATANAPDAVGHGTHVAGIAASTGNDLADGIAYTGVAPDAPLIDVQLGTYSTANILRGMWYFFLHRGTPAGRMALNMSFGGPFGPHDGTTLYETLVSNFVTTNHFVVVSAGNDAPLTYQGTPIQQWHADQVVPGGATATETFLAVPYGWYYLLDGWCNNPADFTVTVTDPCGATASLGSLSGASPAVYTTCGGFQLFKSTGCDRNFQIYIVPFATGSYTIQLTNKRATPERFDLWTGSNGNIPGTAGFTPFDRFGSGSVPGTARNVITVGSYVTKIGPDSVCGASTSLLGGLSGFSGLGPTRAGCGAPSRIKPDVTAPGEFILSAHSSEAGNACSLSPSGHHMIDLGTSMAAPHVTGLLALYMQQAGSTQLTYPAMVARLAASSRPQAAFGLDPNPGSFNDAWGHGKMWIDCSPTATPTSTPNCSNCFWSNAQNANQVEGQPNFTSNAALPVGQRSMSQPAGVFQAGNVLVVSDLGNNRVLVYFPAPGPNGAPAFKVIGQTSWTGNLPNQGLSLSNRTLSAPKGVWTDGTTLVVADTGNDRVLIYNNIFALPTFNGQADTVVGQANKTTSVNLAGPTGVNGPQYVFVDQGRLYVSDNGNNRVLVYGTLPTTDGAYADWVIGQVNFTINTPNQTSPVSAKTLYAPDGVWVYHNTLFVGDAGNNRVLGYDNIGSLSSNDPPADTVVGQNGFGTNTAGNSNNSLTGPFGVAASNCQLYIADTLNFRVMVYNTIPTGTANPPADEILGTGGFASPTQNDMFPNAIAAVNHALYVADSAGSRVLRFGCGQVPPPPTPTFTPTPTPTPTCSDCQVANAQNADLVLGQGGFTTSSNLPVGPASENTPRGVFQGGQILAVADTGNNRILVYNLPFSNGDAAAKVIGQPNLTGSAANAGGLGPRSLALGGLMSGVWTDGKILIAADTGNNRVLIYNNIQSPPFPAIHGAANVVVGQSLMTTNAASAGAAGLNAPTGVFYDGQRLFISDSGNNRVLVYNTLPAVSGMPANGVIGQLNFTANSPNQGGGAP